MIAGLADIRFKAGDLVRVKPEDFMRRWRKPHLRTPGYIFGVIGTVERDCVVSLSSATQWHVTDPATDSLRTEWHRASI